MPKWELKVFDCDGALTNPELEGVPFNVELVRALGRLTRLDLKKIQDIMTERQAAVRADPEKFCSRDAKGRRLAPANADPYLRSNPIINSVLDHVGRFKDPDDRISIVDLVFWACYKHTDTIFRDGAKEVLDAIAGMNAWIVTNSDTAAVQGKMNHIGATWFADRVIGNASKFTLVDDFDRVPETMSLPGLDEPIYLRRKRYFDILDRLRREAGAEWQGVIVVGDVFELDLCLPLALGATIILVANENTPQYEINFVASHKRGHVVHDLKDLLPLLLD